MSTHLDSSLAKKPRSKLKENGSFEPEPLDVYRQQASFNLTEMRHFVDGGEDITEFKDRLWKIMEKDPIFSHEKEKGLSMDGKRRLAQRRCRRVLELDFLNDDEFADNPYKNQALTDVLGSYDWGVSAKHSLNSSVCEGNKCECMLTRFGWTSIKCFMILLENTKL